MSTLSIDGLHTQRSPAEVFAQVPPENAVVLSREELEARNEDLRRLRRRVEELEAERVSHEVTRRRLHNTIQELRGNIRVFCRVRPIFNVSFCLKMHM